MADRESRLAFLCGSHPRCGERSIVQTLPIYLIRDILDLVPQFSIRIDREWSRYMNSCSGSSPMAEEVLTYSVGRTPHGIIVRISAVAIAHTQVKCKFQNPSLPPRYTIRTKIHQASGPNGIVYLVTPLSVPRSLASPSPADAVVCEKSRIVESKYLPHHFGPPDLKEKINLCHGVASDHLYLLRIVRPFLPIVVRMIGEISRGHYPSKGQIYT